MNRRGQSIVMLVVTLLIVAGCMVGALQMMNRGVPAVPGAGPNATPIDAASAAVCGVNKQQIHSALQMYAIQNAPMKTLNLAALNLKLQMPPNSPCSYSLDVSGKVVCKAHP